MKKNRSSIICPSCKRLISASEKRCPFCNIANPGAWWKNNLLVRGIDRPERIITDIISVNFLMYVISLLIYPSQIGLSPDPFSLLSPGADSLKLLGAAGTLGIAGSHSFFSLVSANYLHGSILHILFNMIALKQLAPLIIQEYGTSRMFAIFTLSGVVGFLVSCLAGVSLTIGASAAICGLLGAALYYGKSRGGTYGQTVYKQVSGWIVGLFIFGLVAQNINNWGHGAGIVSGILLGFLMGYEERNKELPLHRTLAGSCVAVTLLVLCWVVAFGLYARFVG